MPCRHGHRGRHDHAGHALDDHRRVPRCSPQSGGQRLGRLRDLRRHPRHAGLRAPSRMEQLAGRVRRHRCPCRSGVRRGAQACAEHQGPRGSGDRPARLRPFRSGHRSPGLRDHQRRRIRMVHRRSRRRARRRRDCAARIRGLGAPNGEADARRPSVPLPGIQHWHGGADRPVPVPVRVLLRGPPVPPADPRLQRAPQRRRPAPHGDDRHAYVQDRPTPGRAPRPTRRDDRRLAVARRGPRRDGAA